MSIDPRGGTGFDPSTHRAGTDWNKNGSVDWFDGAHNQLVFDYVMHEGDAADTDGAGSEGSGSAGGRRRGASSGGFLSRLWAYAETHPVFTIVGGILLIFLVFLVLSPYLVPAP